MHEVEAATVPPVPPHHDRIAVAALILIASLFFADVLVGTANFYLRDLTNYYYPTKKILREIVYNGEFPYWNRLFAAGQPMAANPEHEVFYPLTWLLFLPDYDFGYRMHILIHIWIGLAGMYALLRSMELRPPAAFFGAFSFGMGGIYLSYVNLLPILFCAAWLPLTCLYVRRFFFHRRVRDFALAALFLGLQFLIAEPTTVMQTGFIIGMYALYRGWSSERPIRSMGGNLLLVACISAAAFAVGAVQMLPAIDHAGDSVRARGFSFGLVQQWSMPWAKLMEMIYPHILGHTNVDGRIRYWGGGLYRFVGSPFVFTIYPGLAVTALALGGVVTRSRGVRFVLLLSALSTLLALGSHSPLLQILFDSGIASSLRYPEKFILIAVFTATIFAAQMLQRLLDGDDRVRDAAAGFALSTSLLAAGVAALSYTSLFDNVFLQLWGIERNSGSLLLPRLAASDWKIAAARGLVLAVILFTVKSRRRLLWLTGAAVFLIADILSSARELTPRIPSRFFTEPPPIANVLAPKPKDYRIFHEADWYGRSEAARSYFSTGKGVYWVTRNGLFPMTSGGTGHSLVLERDYDKTALLPTVDFVQSMWDLRRAGHPQWAEQFMSMSNAWYRAVYNNFETERSRVSGDFEKVMPLTFLEGPHYPRYYFAEELIEIRDRNEFVRKLAESPLRPPGPAAFIHEPAFKPSFGRVMRQSESANDATLEVESDGRAFLVMSVTHHKYWRIFIDEKEVRPIRANIGYQGVIVPPGKHLVTMEYRNPLIRIGSIVSIVAAFILVFLVWTPAGSLFRHRE